MTLIRVVPESVHAYGREAQTTFEHMHQSLVTLVNDVVAVRYFGPNAVAFKTECGRIASAFATGLHTDMAAMADAVNTSTSNIAASLGGSPIRINIDAKPITPPTPETVGYVDVDTGALEAVAPVVIRHFDALRTGLNTNLAGLRGTDWEGTAKTNACDAVQRFTTSATGRCDDTQASLTEYINNQVNSVLAADH